MQVSKGPGKVERSILTALRESGRPMTSGELRQAVYGSSWSHAQDASLRASVRRLERKGLVTVRAERSNVVRLVGEGR